MSSDPILKTDEDYKFKNYSKKWTKVKDKKVDHLFKHQEGGLVYAKSYCDHFKGSLEKISDSFIKKINYKKLTEQFENQVNGIKGRWTSLISTVENQVVYIYHQALKNSQCYYDITGIGHDKEFKAEFQKLLRGIRL